MDLTSVWFLLGTLGMAVGTALPLWRFATERRHGRYYAVLATVTFVASLAYLSMALRIGELSVGDATLFLPRHLDWLVTTPLLVLYLGMLCRVERRLYVKLIGADAIFVGSSAVAPILPEPYGYAAYAVGCAAYLTLLHLLLSVLPRRATHRSDRVSALFTKLRNLVAVLWALYPVVWLLGPFGVGLLQPETEVMVVTYLDLVSKVGFVAMAVSGADALDVVAEPGRVSGAPEDSPVAD